MKSIHFYFDVASPNAYLAWAQMPALAKKTGATVVHKPFLLSALFDQIGAPSPAENAAKAAYIVMDCGRAAKRLGVVFKPNPNFPLDTMMAMRAIVGAQREDLLEPVLTAAFRAMWVGGQNLADPNALEALADQAGVEVRTLARWIGDDTVKATLRANTDEAARRGVFGAPAFFVGEEMFFGQDRLAWAAEALKV